MTDLVPHGATASDSTSYQALQDLLDRLGKALDACKPEMEAHLQGMNACADLASTLAGHIAHAEFDPRHVEMTSAVSTALGGAAVHVARLDAQVADMAAGVHDTQRTHARLYGGLDRVRRGRKERTPKPGVFVR